MPLHRATHETAHEEVARLEADGHTITALATDEGGVYIATSPAKKRAKPGDLETRA